jgi:hypothetical protein
MPKLVGTTLGLVDWDKVIADIQHHVGDYNTVTTVVDRSEGQHKQDDKKLSQYREIIDTWTNAGYDLSKIEWLSLIHI